MKTASKLVVPLVIAAIVLGAAVLLLPLGAAARDDQPILTEQIKSNTGLFGGDSEDIQLSFKGGNLPRVAANGSFVALVYEQNNRIFIRSAQAPATSSLGWTNPPTLLDATRGNTPKLAFSPVGTDTLHVVWSGYGGNPEAPEKVIRHAECALAQSVILCSVPHEIESAVGSETLKQPDIVVDGNGRIHVAWYDESSGGSVKTAFSDDGSNWTPSPPIPVTADETTKAGQVALAAADNYVHLAYRDYLSTGAPNRWRVNYTRSPITPTHAWSATNTFGEVLFHDEIRNLTIAAGGPNVFVAYDIEDSLVPDGARYGLIGVSSTDRGVSWGPLKDIPSDNPATPPITKASKALEDDVIPVNKALRPSLAVTDTDNFAIVWQQLPYVPCNPTFNPPPTGPHPSQIYFASPSGNGWSVNGKLADVIVPVTYKVAPDIAGDSNGTHIVFMKVIEKEEPIVECSGGNSTDYTIYYRGPYKEIQISRISYLPVIVKVN